VADWRGQPVSGAWVRARARRLTSGDGVSAGVVARAEWAGGGPRGEKSRARGGGGGRGCGLGIGLARGREVFFYFYFPNFYFYVYILFLLNN
jgi:hypothetical protein